MSTIDDGDSDDIEVYQYPQKCTAADIPPELFELILYFLMPQVGIPHSQDDVLQVVDVSKREMCSCGLTCRYWADLCLSKAFEHLRITSRDELLELAEFVRSPHSYLRRYVTRIDLVQVDVRLPWIHHAAPLVDALAWEIVGELQYTLTLEGPGFAHEPKHPPRSIRSIHQCVPRLIPPSMSPFDRLYLSNVHFRSFNDLLRLVGELPALTQLILDRISWTDLPAATPVVRGRSRPFYAEVSAVQAYWPFARLFAGSKRAAQKATEYLPSPMDSHDQGVLDRLYRCIFAGVPSDSREDAEAMIEARFSCFKHPVTQQTKIAGRVWAHDGPHHHYRFVRTHGKSRALTPALHAVYERLDPLSPTYKTDYARIKYLEVNLEGAGMPFEQAIERDWAEFDVAASQLPFLRGVAIGANSPNDIAVFSEQKSELFATLKAKRMLLLGHQNSERGLWYPEGVDSTKNPDAGVDELWKMYLRHV